MNKIFSILIGKAYAQDLIHCEDGTMADPAIGCIKTPDAILSSQSSLLEIILKTADTVVTIAVALAVAVLIYGGISYALSLGNEEKIKEAKNILFWGVFGLITTLLAKYIVAAVLVLISQ